MSGNEFKVEAFRPGTGIVIDWKYYKKRRRWHAMGQLSGDAWFAECVELACGRWIWSATWGECKASGKADSGEIAKRSALHVLNALRKVNP